MSWTEMTCCALKLHIIHGLELSRLPTFYRAYLFDIINGI